MIINPLSAVFAALPLADLNWLDRLIDAGCHLAPDRTFFHYPFNVRALLALILVSLCCGAVGSLVVGGRMAFFSDALAHCSFAGISIGFLIFTGLLAASFRPPGEFWDWATTVMVAFGILAGCGIVWVRTRTGLSSDTVIGVFFAGAVGLAAALRTLIHSRALFSLEDFLFGNPLLVFSPHLMVLALLVLITAVLLAWTYNYLLLASFNSSLALSRRVPVGLVNYLFIVLLALIVNLCLRFIGALLINALLIIPAATAVNLSRNMRQLFWRAVFLTLALSVGGCLLSSELENRWGIRLGISGTIVLLNVAAFVLSMVLGPRLHRRKTA